MTTEKHHAAIERAIQAERVRILELAGLARVAARLGVSLNLESAVRSKVPVAAMRKSVLNMMAEAADEEVISGVAVSAILRPPTDERARAQAMWRAALQNRPASVLP